MAKFMSMKDIIGKKGGDDDDDRKGGKKPKEDYVGGGASGLNVVNPVDRIFAKESESADGVQQGASTDRTGLRRQLLAVCLPRAWGGGSRAP